MENVCPGEIYKSCQHLYPTTWWQSEVIPPDTRFRHRPSRRWQVEGGIKPLDNLKWVYVYVERMCRPSGRRVVKERPLFSGSQLHVLIDFTADFLAVDGVHRS